MLANFSSITAIAVTSPALIKKLFNRIRLGAGRSRNHAPVIKCTRDDRSSEHITDPIVIIVTHLRPGMLRTVTSVTGKSALAAAARHLPQAYSIDQRLGSRSNGFGGLHGLVWTGLSGRALPDFRATGAKPELSRPRRARQKLTCRSASKPVTSDGEANRVPCYGRCGADCAQHATHCIPECHNAIGGGGFHRSAYFAAGRAVCADLLPFGGREDRLGSPGGARFGIFKIPLTAPARDGIRGSRDKMSVESGLGC